MTCPGTAWVVTQFGDVEIHAHPQHEPEDEARAQALGYPHVGAMVLEHDPLHAVVERVLGVPSLLRSEKVSPERAQAEEEVILAVQRLLCIVRAEQ